MRFAIGDATAHGRAYAGRVGGIDEIQIQADDGARGVVVGGDANGVAHHFAHAAFVDVAHGEGVHAGILDQAPLLRIKLTHADEHHVARLDLGVKAAEIDEFRRAVAHQRRQRHAVHVAGRRTVRRVHIAVGVEPDISDALFLLAIEAGDARA